MDFRILGPLEVATPDGVAPIGGAKQRALLAILLLNANEVVSSDRLIDALWGERPPDTAAKALQVHVSQLRKALVPELIRTRPPGYALELGSHELDVNRFRELHDEARSAAGSEPEHARALLGEALDLWRGPPLADFAYEPFAQADIGRLEELRAAALEDRIAADLALGRHARVVGELESLIAAHPHRERLRVLLMLALYRSGRQAEALDAYQDARAALTAELGIEPSRELRELQERVLNQDPELDHSPPPAAPDARAHASFVGRERELGELGRGLDDALGGRGRVMLVSGEPGIGKSTLADELLRRARDRGARVLVGRCWEAGGAPAYWPWVQVLRAYLREADPDAVRAQLGREGADVATMVPELRDLVPDLPPAPDIAGDGARFRLLESVASFLGKAAAGRPLVLFFDDLHAADAPSLLLVRFAAAQLAEVPILIVGCYRDTEVGPELGDALAELSREPAVGRLALRGLSETDTSRLLELTMGEGPEHDLAARVQAETQGNPLFATEIGRLLASEGAREHDRLPIPEGIRETIGRRVSRQSDRCREVLALASVMGREFDPRVIGRVGDLDEDDLFPLLDEAAAARLVGAVPEAGGRLRFSHILVRDVLYEDLSAARRMRLHGAIADALEKLFAANPGPHLAELARHYLAAGPAAADKAIDYSRRAGDQATSQHAYEEAVRHYAEALRVMEVSGPSDPADLCELLLPLGEALRGAGNAEESKRVLLRAVDLAEAAGRADQVARAALGYGGPFSWARASTDPLLVPLMERALAALGDGDSPTRVRLLARLAAATRDNPKREPRVRMAEEAVAMAKRIGDPAILASALEGQWEAIEGPPDVAGGGVEAGARLTELGRQAGDLHHVYIAHDLRFNGFLSLADRAGVDVELDALARLADELRQPARRWYVGTARTMVALLEGRLEDAEHLIDETLAEGERAESWNAAVSHRIALFVLRREQGRLAELEGTVARSIHEYPALFRFRTAQVHLYGELGREADARAAFDAVLAHDLANEYVDAEWLFSMCMLADPCAFLGDEEAAARLYSLLLPHEHLYARAPVEAVFGSAARGLGVLATVLGAFDDAERHFLRAIEVEWRMGARPWLAHAQHGLAAMLLERGEDGDVERARALVEEALATYRELGMESWGDRLISASARR
ncbi:MAG: eukaryotic-like serine/threonine-protein kinase [Thermoleophilaceae bacterium]|nr:eukaryotic-like serine/threonine-protein kinase [Thermoleophilaceae bacterium]